jgi:hypothetical protein
MSKKAQKIQIVFETTIEVDQEFADFMEMTLDEALAYQIDTIREYEEDRMSEVAFATFKGIRHVEEV